MAVSMSRVAVATLALASAVPATVALSPAYGSVKGEGLVYGAVTPPPPFPAAHPPTHPPTLRAAATIVNPSSGTTEPLGLDSSKKSLVVLLPQIGEFDSCELCEQLAAVEDDLAR